MSYFKTVEVRWSDLDPNFHLRHSVYYDWAAYCRTAFLSENGLTHEFLHVNELGPVLFREECVFHREIRFGDPVRVYMECTQSRRDFSRWAIRHQIYAGAEKPAATLTVSGAWINTRLRKLMVPPEQAIEVFSRMPRSNDFAWMES